MTRYDDRVSDALDRLTNRKSELESAIRLVLVAWDGMSEDLKEDLVMVDAIEVLRGLVPK